VPKTRVARDGLRTSPNAVYDSIERHGELVGAPGMPELAPAPVDPYRWELFNENDTYRFYALFPAVPTDHEATFTTLGGEVIGLKGGWLYGQVKNNGAGMWLDGIPDADAQAWVARNPAGV
jgi:hypothetical protein